MKVALAVDAVVPPLTGIGRYAWELARHFVQPEYALSSVKFYFAGGWIDDPIALLDGNASASRRKFRQLPRIVRGNRRFRRWVSARESRDHLFHSPNYFLPEDIESGVITVHDLSIFRFPETHPEERLRQFDRNFTRSLKRARHLITDAESVRQEVAAFFGWPLDRISAVPLGVSPRFRPRGYAELALQLDTYGLAPGGYSLCVSTLEPRKRLDRLIEAYAELSPALRLNYPLVLVGSRGWLNQDLLDQIERAERQGWLKYLGFVPEAELPTLYAGAHAFFMPSLYEGFGLPVLEAMASGVPALTSNTSSLPEVAGGAAWQVDPDDHEQFRQGIEMVLSDAAWRGQAIGRGLEVAGQATWQRCVMRTIDVYRRLGGS